MDEQPVVPVSFDAQGEDPEWVHEPDCETCGHCDRDVVIEQAELEAFVAGVLERYGVSRHEGEIVARVLVASDLRGIPSHGVARLQRYLTGIERGFIVPGAQVEIWEPLPAIAVLDARNGIGQVAAEQAMDLALHKAREQGVGVVTVRRSNHYGIAGYYAMKALEHGMIGVSMTNAAPLVVPTFGRDVLLGTNPIAFAAPARNHPGFVLDMATSVVPRGKLEVYDRDDRQMPVGWSLDEEGFDCQNPKQVLRNMAERLGGGILPLGGRGETFSGHKGYGLAFMVDILCGVLSGAGFGRGVNDLKRPVPPGEVAGPDVGHFFLALDIQRFLPLAEFEQRLAAYIADIQGSQLARGEERILVHGQKEFERAACHAEHGIPLARNVADKLVSIAQECGHPPPVSRT